MSALEPVSALEPRPGLLVLDVRDEPEFHAGHLPGSGHLPLAELDARRVELPPRDAAVVVVGASAAQARAGALELARLGYRDVAWLDAPLAGHAGRSVERGPGARLWRPAPFLEHVVARLPRGRALDVAAGSGRESVFLALNGWTVEAWDRAPEALERARALAARCGVAIETVAADFERRGAALPRERYEVVVCFRFLQRTLFAAMAGALRPGGHLVYETYRAGQERFGRPTHGRFLLRPGELRDAFPGLEVIEYEELDPEAGPVTARLWARRPAAGGALPRP